MSDDSRSCERASDLTIVGAAMAQQISKALGAGRGVRPSDEAEHTAQHGTRACISYVVDADDNIVGRLSQFTIGSARISQFTLTSIGGPPATPPRRDGDAEHGHPEVDGETCGRLHARR